MLDREGFRPNVGIVLLNSRNQVFWGKRLRTHSWQFPQGGIKYGESPEQAMFRALHAEGCAGSLPGAETDLVPAQAPGPRQRHEPARHRSPRIRRLALERLLGA